VTSTAIYATRTASEPETTGAPQDGVTVTVGRSEAPESLDATKIEELVNQERIKAGLTPLVHNDLLKQSACAKADDMIAKDYWEHVSPDGITPRDWIIATGYEYDSIGENLAEGFASDEALVAGWMKSLSHKENILRDYTEFGTCTKIDPDYKTKQVNITVQHFGRP
jgi:uncharacterized protein YkwD